MLRILIVGEPSCAEMLGNSPGAEVVQVSIAGTAELALEEIKQLRPDLVISDMGLPGIDGLAFLDRVLAKDPAMRFLLLSSRYSEDFGIEAVRRGASDCWSKPFNVERLQRFVRELAQETTTRQQTLQLESDLSAAYEFEGLVGRSPLMLEVFAKIRRIAPHFRSVLVTGGTGTGKELLAKAIHRLSPAAQKTFVICDCSTLVENLIESQLFGHVRGAFTGAFQDTAGIFESADGGTVFLDEVGELPLAAQAKLLRVLQNQEVQRVGSPLRRPVEVRVIAATHRNLREMVGTGRFRQDLFYRLSMLEIRLPNLAERKEDLPLLERHLLNKYCALYHKDISGISRRAQMQMAAYSWPGNVRELENVISGACIMSTGHFIDIVDLPPVLRSKLPHTTIESAKEILSLEALEQRHVSHVLNLLKNKAKTAEVLGISRSKLYDILRRAQHETAMNVRHDCNPSVQ